MSTNCHDCGKPIAGEPLLLPGFEDEPLCQACYDGVAAAVVARMKAEREIEQNRN